MKRAPLILLEDTVSNRVDRIHQEYVMERWQAYQRVNGDDDTAHALLADYLNGALDAIRKRLGGARHKKLKRILNEALVKQRTGKFELHKQWIEHLLRDYYDPMYSYQLDKKHQRIILTGTHDEILDWYKAQLDAPIDTYVRL